MDARKMIRFSTAMVLVIGLVLLAATGRVAAALGAQGGEVLPGATDPPAVGFWFQLAFMRLFGTTLVGLGAVLFWCQATLSASQPDVLGQGAGSGNARTEPDGRNAADCDLEFERWLAAGCLLAECGACLPSRHYTDDTWAYRLKGECVSQGRRCPGPA
jgi:hypothetical protein